MLRLFRGIRTSISVKLLIVSELLLILTIILIMASVLPRMRDQIIKDIQNRLLAVANTAALQLDGDALKTIRNPKDAYTPAFQILKLQLTRIRLVNDLDEEHIYTFFVDPTSAGRVRFGVMTHANPFVGDPYPMREEMLPVFADGVSKVTALYADKNGQWISAYAPIMDSRGGVAGLLEVDEKADAYFADYNQVKWTTAGLSGLVLVASSLIGWIIVTSIVVRPMKAVHDGMNALRRSEFSHRVMLRTGDEFQSLGDTFNHLARELNVARSVQASFAPKDIPSQNGWAIAAASQPCDATAGDYVDAFELPGDRIAVVVADVTGHGLGPALLMSACRSTLRALSGLDLSPAKIVERIDAMISADLTEGRFITMIFGVLSPDGRFTFCNAGHGPAMAIRAGIACTLESHRPPVGLNWICADGEGESSIQLQPGDRLLLASDGVTEAFNNADEQFGDERLIKIVCDALVPHDAVVSSIAAAVGAHRGARAQSDDITILCVDRV